MVPKISFSSCTSELLPESKHIYKLKNIYSGIYIYTQCYRIVLNRVSEKNSFVIDNESFRKNFCFQPQSIIGEALYTLGDNHKITFFCARVWKHILEFNLYGTLKKIHCALTLPIYSFNKIRFTKLLLQCSVLVRTRYASGSYIPYSVVVLYHKFSTPSGTNARNNTLLRSLQPLPSVRTGSNPTSVHFAPSTTRIVLYRSFANVFYIERVSEVKFRLRVIYRQQSKQPLTDCSFRNYCAVVYYSLQSQQTLINNSIQKTHRSFFFFFHSFIFLVIVASSIYSDEFEANMQTQRCLPRIKFD